MNALHRTIGVLGTCSFLLTGTPATAQPAPINPVTRLDPVPLLLISQGWRTPAPGAISLPCLTEGVVRFATEEAIHEGPPLFVRPSIWAASWVPETGESFSYFQRHADRLNYDLQGDPRGVSFVGRNRRGEFGIYHYSTNRLEKTWVKTGTSIPAGPGQFTRLEYPMSVRDYACFIGLGTGGFKGVYRASTGAVERIADIATPVPGGTNRFRDFSYARVQADGAVVFTGYSETGSGLYLFKEGTLRTLLDRASKEPRSAKSYAGALLVGLEDSWAYFTSFGTTLSLGRVRLDGSSIETLVDETTALPGESGTLGALNYASVDGGRIMFEATSEGSDFNVYLWDQGRIRPLVRRGDSVDEGRILSVRSGLQALSGNRFVCMVDVYKEDRESFNRGVYLGDLSPNAGMQFAKAREQPRKPAWFRLGSAPIEVFAREPRRDTNNLVRQINTGAQ